MRALFVLALAVVCTGGRAGPVWAAGDTPLTAQQIVDRALEKNAFGFENAKARIHLKLVSKRGKERLRDIEIRSVRRNTLNRTLIRFHAPADVAGSAFLVIEHADADDEQYLYLPALGKVKRISGSQKNQRFMGTDLTYADLESGSLRDGVSKRLPDAHVGGNATYVVESIPKEDRGNAYGKTITYVHQSSFVPLKIEFFDKRMRPLKTLTVTRLEKRDDGWVVRASHIKNLQAGTQTLMTVRKLNTKVDLGDDEFTQRALLDG